MAKLNLPVQKNQQITTTITDLTYEGMGVAKIEGYPLFVPTALPGEKVILHVLKTNKNYGYAKVINYLTKSQARVAGSDNAYTQAGIAPLQHLSYEQQLKFKRKIVVDLLKKAHLDQIEVSDTLGMDNPLHYRNKAQVPIRRVNNELATGFFRKGSHKFIALKDFLIQDKRIDEILQTCCQILQAAKISAYDEQTHTGILRHLMVRRGYYSKEVLVVLVTKEAKLDNKTQLAKKIIQACPDVVGVLQNINSAKTNVILGEKTIILAGKDEIIDELNGLRFKISAQSFYQVNPIQTEKLYNIAIKKANLTGKETVIDAYCGIGTISLNLAKYAKKVYGVEIIQQAIADAKKNAALNGLTNLEFEVGDAKEWMATWQKAGLKPDVIVVDPPRKGLSEDFILSASQMQPQKIVYISCNPATLVRDLTIFQTQGYQVKGPIQPVDQFPQTPHVETVVKLVRKTPDAYIDLKVDMDELDLTASEAKATYQEIKQYILDKYDTKVSNLYIAQVKEKYGIIERENYNKPKSENSKQLQCPAEKVEMIEEAMRYFKMI